VAQNSDQIKQMDREHLPYLSRSSTTISGYAPELIEWRPTYGLASFHANSSGPPRAVDSYGVYSLPSQRRVC
jgi:hypothetical protein